MTYALHSQQWYFDRATAIGDAPRWLRVAWLGFARHRANGHAQFSRGELGRLLNVDQSTGLVGEGVSASRVSEAIGQAVDNGLLSRGSKAACLVVPYPGIWQGPGSDFEACTKHPSAIDARLRVQEARLEAQAQARRWVERQAFLRLSEERRAHDSALTGAA